MADDVNVKFGAEVAGAVAGIKQVADGVKNFSEQAKGQIEGITATFGKLQEAMIGIAAIVAGGAMFKEMINSTLETTSAVTKLQKGFGMTLEEANKTKSQLDLLGISTDTYAQSASMLVRQLRAGSDGLTKMGFTARDLDLGQKGVMDKAIAKLGEYKEGIDRTIAAQTMFGRGGSDAAKLVRLNLDGVVTKAKELEETLNLTVNPQTQANAAQYKTVMNELQMAFDGIKNTIGNAVLPYLTQFANWFVSIAPSVIRGMQSTTATVVAWMFDVVSALGNFAISAIEQINSLIGSMDDLKRAAKGVAAMTLGGGLIGLALGGPAGGLLGLAGGGILGAVAASIDTGTGEIDKSNERLEAARKKFQDGLASFRAMITSGNFNAPSLPGSPKGSKGAGDLLTPNTQGASAAQKEMDGELKVISAGLAQKKELLQLEYDLHKINDAQKYQSLQDYTDDAYEDEKQLLEKELALWAQGSTQYASVKARMAQLDQAYANNSTKIYADAVRAQQSKFTEMFGAVQSAFNGQLRGLLARTTTWSQAFKSIIGDLVIAFIQAIEKMGFEWLAGELAKTSATTAGVAARTGAEVSGQSVSMAANFATVIKSIFASASQTFAGIFGFLSPVMGPAAAGPAVAGEATVAAMASAVPALAQGTPWVMSDGLGDDPQR